MVGFKVPLHHYFIETPSLEGFPTKANEDPSPHEMRLCSTGHQPSIFWSRALIPGLEDIIIILILLLFNFDFIIQSLFHIINIIFFFISSLKVKIFLSLNIKFLNTLKTFNFYWQNFMVLIHYFKRFFSRFSQFKKMFR